MACSQRSPDRSESSSEEPPDNGERLPVDSVADIAKWIFFFLTNDSKYCEDQQKWKKKIYHARTICTTRK